MIRLTKAASLAFIFAAGCGGNMDTTELSDDSSDPTVEAGGESGPLSSRDDVFEDGDQAPPEPDAQILEDQEELVDKIYGTAGTEPSYGVVGLRLTMQNGTTQNCSGALLNNFVLVTAAHCLQPINAAGVTPIGNIVLSTRITYQAPGGGGSFTTTKNIFYYQDNGWDGVSRVNDIAVGASGTSLGLNTNHFLTLFRGDVVTGNPLVLGGYGRPTVGTAMALDVNVGTESTGRFRINSARAWQGFCSGDSGGPAMRAAGYTTNGFQRWRSVPGIATGASSVDPLPGQPAGVLCNNNGTATDVVSKNAWINEIVEFWPEGVHTCQNFTNTAGDPAAWCWQTQ